MSSETNETGLDARKLLMPPTRKEIFSVLGPLFRAINNQEGAIIALKAGDQSNYDERMAIASGQLDAALNALSDFLGATK